MINKTTSLLALTFLFASTSFAQSKMRPPDLLGPDTQPAKNVSEAAGDVEAVETDKEPVPIIRKKKVDTNMQSESRYIEHPNAEKGLIKIDKDKVYYYKVKESEQSKAGNFKIAIYDPVNLAGRDGVTYDQIYDETSSPMLIYEHEWQIYKKLGRLGLTAGGGFFYSAGNGQFDPTSANAGLRPREKFTFFVFPVSVGVIYRAEFYDTQPIAPYAGAGIGGMLFAETRDDDQNPALGARYGASPVATGYVGAAIQLGRGARSFLDLDREYGINKVWITGEYRRYVYISGDFDFSGDAINGGLTAEF